MATRTITLPLMLTVQGYRTWRVTASAPRRERPMVDAIGAPVPRPDVLRTLGVDPRDVLWAEPGELDGARAVVRGVDELLTVLTTGAIWSAPTPVA